MGLRARRDPCRRCASLGGVIVSRSRSLALDRRSVARGGVGRRIRRGLLPWGHSASRWSMGLRGLCIALLGSDRDSRGTASLDIGKASMVPSGRGRRAGGEGDGNDDQGVRKHSGFLSRDVCASSAHTHHSMCASPTPTGQGDYIPFMSRAGTVLPPRSQRWAPAAAGDRRSARCRPQRPAISIRNSWRTNASATATRSGTRPVEVRPRRVGTSASAATEARSGSSRTSARPVPD